MWHHLRNKILFKWVFVGSSNFYNSILTSQITALIWRYAPMPSAKGILIMDLTHFTLKFSVVVFRTNVSERSPLFNYYETL